MSYGYAEFQAAAQRTWNSSAALSTRAAEWAAVIAGVAADTRKHDKTIDVAPAALKIGLPQTPFTSEINLLINKGLGGNLLQSQMVSALGAVSATAEPPGEIRKATIFASAAPPVVGTVLTVSPGTWANATSFTYQWTRDGTNIAGATATTYTLVSADVGGHALAVVESGVNATGTSVGKPSRPIQVP